MPHVRTLIAVNYLKNKQIIEEDAVFVTGLVHDNQSGAYIPNENELKKYSLDVEGIVKLFLSSRFYRIPISDEPKRVYEKDIVDYLETRSLMKENG